MVALGSRGKGPWQVWVDTGGTFTDCLALDPAGKLHRAKVLSSSCLRVRLASPLERGRCAIAPSLGLPGGALPGWCARPLGAKEAPASLDSWEPETGEIVLAEGEERSWRQGLALELSSPDEAPLLAARLVTATRPDGLLPLMELRLATTLGTNALLERRGAAVALFVTRGFGDLLIIGDQRRPDLFALAITKPPPLYREVVEVPERRDARGQALEPLGGEALRARARELVASGVVSAAIALLHAFLDPKHEDDLAALLRESGFLHVSTSASLAPVQGYLPRAETAVIDAYLAPILDGYLRRIAGGLEGILPPDAQEAIPAVSVSARLEWPSRARGTPLRLMTSAGGLVAAAAFRAKDGLLSGPAAGVVGALEAGRRSGRRRLLTFDMGGTSTDVARCDDELPYLFEHRVGAARLLAPAVAVQTVAAGGGSICWFDGHQVRVGPESGGARPGPACYGAGGPLCLTDVNLLLGRLDPGRFHLPLDLAAARKAFAGLERQITRAGGVPARRELLLEGLRRIADERMADAIREISVRQGYQPADYTLLAFGGAGPQHACAVAELLGIREVLIPADAGLLSAAGLGAAAVERFAIRGILTPLEEVAHQIPGWCRQLGDEARQEVAAEGVPGGQVEVSRLLSHLRFLGQESAVEVAYEEGVDLPSRFRQRYRELYGYLPEGEVEVVSLRAVARSRPAAGRQEEAWGGEPESAEDGRGAPPAKPTPAATVRSWVAGRWQELPVYRRDGLRPGDRLAGPALVAEAHSTTVVEPAWELQVDAVGALLGRYNAPP
jgi:5-oxoprolinase (ATP-hydrolysing)